MDRIVTKTLAEIYLKQGHLQEAYEIFKILAEKNPSDSEIQNKIETLKKYFNASTQNIRPPFPSKEEKIRFLEKWLDTIQKQRRR